MAHDATLRHEEQRVRALSKERGYSLHSSDGRGQTGTFALSDAGGAELAIYGLTLRKPSSGCCPFPVAKRYASTERRAQRRTPFGLSSKLPSVKYHG
jgi:hypothetical protein